MTEDRLYKQIRDTLKNDFVPVKPLKEAWKRAFWIFPLTLFCIVFTLEVFHLRPDYLNFHLMELWGFILLQVLACYFILSESLKTGIPGSFVSPFRLTVLGVIGPVVFLIASMLNYEINPSHPAAGQEWAMGMACISIVGGLGFLALLAGVLLSRSGLPFRAGTVGLLLGLSGGLTAEASWRLHCPFTSWDHVLVFHGGAIIILAAAGLAVGSYWKRRAAARSSKLS
ncbi:MAG: NrsF family protein [Acidobacteriota bacterium]